MNKLRLKVFWIIFGIMTGALLLAVIIYNINGYITAQDMLRKSAEMRLDPFAPPQFISESTYFSYVVKGFFDNLIGSIVFFIAFTIVFFFIAKYLTKWIVRPAEDAFKKQRDFIADASHELKTPLSVIIASSDALAENPKDLKWIKNIQTESNRMTHLISKLLTLASTENIENSHFENGNLSKTVELCALTFEGKAIENNINLSLDIKDNIFYKYDENEIKELVEILLDNATCHSIKNSEIQLSLYKDGKSIVLEVINSGEGIAPGDEEKIFERFYRSNKARDNKEKRFGLGLSIAKNIVENHKGSISAKSKDGKTTFKVILN